MKYKKGKNFEKLSLFDLAAARVVNCVKKVDVKKGDLVEIVSPFVENENYIGIVVKVSKDRMHVYHSDIRKTVVWDRRVNCNVSHI